jgi:hypothetical protein
VHKVAFKRISGNSKTGPIPTTVSSAKTCPDSCPLKARGCYASAGFFTGLHWKKVTSGERGGSIKELCNHIRKLPKQQLWRHNVAGDLYGVNDSIAVKALEELTKANKGRHGFTYTHKPVLKGRHAKKNREAVKNANKNGFTVNLSADNYKEADELADLSVGPVVTIMPRAAKKNEYTPSGRKVVICPALTKEDVTCASCGLCQKRNRSCIIGFPAHGAAAKTVEKIFNEG